MTRSGGRRFMGIPDEFWIGFVIMVGFFLKLIYDIKLGYTAGTPDAGTWQELGGGSLRGGHIEVIHYFFTWHHFPDFSPRGLAGYANPPLYYILSSLVMEILHRMMGWSAGVSLYCVLALNVIYVMVGECCGIGILQKFGVRGRKLVVGILFLIFFPTFYHLSGAMDGSALSFMFSMLALNGALSWYGSRRKKTLTKTAIWLGLGLMTGYSCIGVLPPMLLLFISAAGDGRRNQTPLKVQFRRFALIVGIMGMIWPVYLTLRFHLPLFYVEPAGELIRVPFVERLRLPGRALLTHLHTVGEVELESNIWAQTMKTAILDFCGIEISLKGTRVIAVFLLALSIAICVLANLMLLYTLFAAKRIDRVHRRFLLVGYLTLLIGYIAVCGVLPYTGTMSFKSIAPILIYPLTGLCVCGSGDVSDNAFEKASTAVVNGMILVLAFITAFLFGFYAA